MDTIALFGAAGKIGTRITEKLRAADDYRTLYVEAGEAGIARLRERGLEPTSQADALREADTIVLAIPDTLIGTVASAIVPRLRSGTLVILLDPAAPHGGELPSRDDIAYFVVHPCHPPIVDARRGVSDETGAAADAGRAAADADFWGGVAKQAIVCALMQGTELDYAKGERLAKVMFAPILRVHRITVAQMAILEPAMAETMILTCMVVMKEAVEAAIAHGVPREVATDFALGHMRVNLGILFGFIDAEVSAGAKLAVAWAKERVFQPGWEQVFEPDSVMAQVRAIVQARSESARSESGPSVEGPRR
jgi:hypothetical protein